MSDRSAPILNRQLKIFLLTMILANIAGGMTRPLLPLYLKSLGASVEQVGVFYTVSMLIPLAFQILGGWLSDSIGRLKAIAIGSLGGLAGSLIFPFVNDWRWLLLASIGSSVAFSFVAPSYRAYIAEQSSNENLGRVFGITENIYLVVDIIGPIMGGWLSDQYGFRLMYMASALFYGVATVLRVWMSRTEKFSSQRPLSKPSFTALKKSLLEMAGLLFAGGIVTWIFLADGVRDISYTLNEQFQPIFMQDLAKITNTQIGWLVALSTGVSMLIISPSGWLVDKKGERPTIIAGLLCYIAGFGIFTGSRQIWGFALAMALFGAGNGLISPAYNTLVSKAIPEKLRGVAFGLLSTSVGFISLPMPYLGGLMYSRVNPISPFIVLALFNLLLIPIAWRKFHLSQK